MKTKISKDELLEKAIDSHLPDTGLSRDDILIWIRPMEGDGRPVGAAEILCQICAGVIACAIWDGIKWVWENYPHNCSEPPEPEEPPPQTCPRCHVQLKPGKPHYCK